MTKRDLINEVAHQFPGFSRRDAEVVVNSVFESMTDALSRDERVEIRGFGSFVVKHRQARAGRNPKTGAVVSVEAKRVPFFKVGKELKLRMLAPRSRRFLRAVIRKGSAVRFDISPPLVSVASRMT
jgi:integration host factor subunit beta